MSRFFTIIGAGSGQPGDLTRQARDAMANAGLLLSTGRLAENLSPCSFFTIGRDSSGRRTTED